MSASSAFLRFWLSEDCRDALLSHVERDDLPSFRLVCHDFGARAAPYLFKEINVTFKATTFSKPARMAALESIGHHVRTLTFNLPHTAETFLPPLIDPVTGEERSFVYTPQVHKPTTLIGKVKEPKYGSWEITDLLIKQYPPLFHAATNIPAFIRAFSALSSLSHLKISCPDQEPAQRYRRSIVDYALISVRMAIERAPLYSLDTLSLLPIHPAGLVYLQPILGFGATPGSSRRWRQIRKLAIHMDSFPFDQPFRTEHLKILHAYLRTFAPSLTRLFFRWKGEKGPSPLSLPQEPCLQTDTLPATTYSKNATAAQPLPRPPPQPQPRTPPRNLQALQFAKLRHMELENAIMDSSQIALFISTHRRSLTEFLFEDITLRSGDWDDALAPLTRISGSEEWKRRQEEVMDVPLVLVSPTGSGSAGGSGSEEPRVMGPLAGGQQEEEEGMGVEKRGVGGLTMSRWFSISRSGSVRRREKEKWFGCEEHMRKFLRASVFPWR